MRLGLAVDDLEINAEALLHQSDELRAVSGRTAGFGRDGAGAGHAARGHLVAANAQRLEGARDGRLSQAAAQRQAFAQPHDPGERVDDAKSVRGGPRDQKPAIVGAKVKGCVSRRGGAPWRSSLRRRPVDPPIGTQRENFGHNQTSTSPPPRFAQGPQSKFEFSKADGGCNARLRRAVRRPR